MKSTTLFTAATALFGSTIANPVNSGSKSTRSTADLQSVEALLGSSNAFSDEVAVIGDVKLLIDNSKTILTDMDTRLKRMGVDKHAIRHRSLDRGRPHNTGKLVPIAQIAEKVQKGINELTEIILKIECPPSLPMADYTRCLAAQDDPLQRLREYYPDSMDWDGYEDHGPASGTPSASLSGPKYGNSSRTGPPIWGTVCSKGCASTSTSTMIDVSTMTAVVSTMTITAGDSSSPASTLSDYTNVADNSSTSSSDVDVGYMTSTQALISTMTGANVTVSRNTVTLTIDTTSSYTSLATVTIDPTNSVTFTLTTETTMTTTETGEYDATETMDVTSTISVESVIYPDTATAYTTSSSPSPSSEADSISTESSWRTVWMPTTKSPFWYGTRTPPVPAAPSPSSTAQSTTRSTSTTVGPWTVHRSSNAGFPTSYRVHGHPWERR